MLENTDALCYHGAMGKQEDFVSQVEIVLNTRIGKIIAGSVLKNNLSKLNKNVASITKEDGIVLVNNIVKAVALFETKNESQQIKADLEKLLALLS